MLAGKPKKRHNLNQKIMNMRKTFLVILMGTFVLPNLCESYLSIDAKVVKEYGSHQKPTGNIHNSDSVSVDYDEMSGTITIGTTADSKEVGVNIYKDGSLLYSDKDKVEKTSSLIYTLTDEESGEYDVCVDVEGSESVMETVVKE